MNLSQWFSFLHEATTISSQKTISSLFLYDNLWNNQQNTGVHHSQNNNSLYRDVYYGMHKQHIVAEAVLTDMSAGSVMGNVERWNEEDNLLSTVFQQCLVIVNRAFTEFPSLFSVENQIDGRRYSQGEQSANKILRDSYKIM